MVNWKAYWAKKKQLENPQEKQKIVKEIGSGVKGEYLNCFYCKKVVAEELIAKSANKKICCENCYDPNDPDQKEEQEEDLNVEIEPAEEKTQWKNFININTSGSEKDKQKAIEINSEELNKQIEIPKELNIVDCPPDVNPNKDWFRIQFKNFWRLFHNDSEWTFIIHDRGTCKSKNDAILILYEIVMFDDYEGSFIMRNWEEPTRQTKEYFKKIIKNFSEVIYIGERKVKSKEQWELLWLSTYKGVSFKKKVSDKSGELRCHFFSLFDPDQARTLIDKPIRTVIFDECIPTRNQIKENKGWKIDEPGKYMEVMKSLGRGTRPKKIFTGNPNDSFYECWMLKEHFKEELKKLSKWYWKNRPNNLNAWLEWAWIKELKKGNKTIQLQKIATTKEDFDNYEEGNWDNFFEKAEDLKIVEHKNGAIPQYIFNNCFAYIAKENYFYFIRQDSKEVSTRDRQAFKNLPELYVNDEQRRKSRQLAKWDRRGDKGVVFQQSLLRYYETNLLFFADTFAKKVMEEYIGKRKTTE